MTRASELCLASAAVILLAVCASACGTPSNPPNGGPVCAEKALVHQPSTEAQHLATCSESCGNGANPPTGGNHCGSTLACRVFDAHDSECKWIHNLEHGHAVLLYNCPAGCPDDVETLRSIWSASGGAKRMIVAPWPKLEKKFAAVVWGWSWSGDVLDRDAISCVLQHQDEEAPEAGLGCAQ